MSSTAIVTVAAATGSVHHWPFATNEPVCSVMSLTVSDQLLPVIEGVRFDGPRETI